MCIRDRDNTVRTPRHACASPPAIPAYSDTFSTKSRQVKSERIFIPLPARNSVTFAVNGKMCIRDSLKGMYEICGEETAARILKSGKNEIMEAIKFEKVNFSYGGEEKDSFALRDVSFSVEEGEFVAVLGHNGSGKSTLARLVDGLLSPSDGKISVLGLDAAEGKNTFEIRLSLIHIYAKYRVALRGESAIIGSNPPQIASRQATDSISISAVWTYKSA